VKNWSNEAKLGVFIIAGFAVLFWLTFSIGGKKLFAVGGKKSFIVYFKTITGVTEKSDVRMAGVKIGEVRKVELENYRAKVTVDLHGDYDVPDDSVATVQGKGLLGEKFIEIKPGFSPTYVPTGGVLAHSTPPANIDDMVAKLSDALDDIKTVTNSLSESFGSEEGKQGLKSIISNLSNLSKDLNDVVGGNKEKLTQIITNVDKATAVLQLILSENRVGLKGTIDNFNSVSKSFAEKAPDLLEHLDKAASGIHDLVADNRANLKDSMSNIKEASGNFNGVLVENRENFKVAMENLKKSSEKLDEIMASVKQITAKIEKGEGTIGKLVQEEEVYNGLNETLEGAKNLTKQTGAMKVGIGARVELNRSDLPAEYVLFGEDAGRVLISCDESHLRRIQEVGVRYGVAADSIGRTVPEKLEVLLDGRMVVAAGVSELKYVWAQSLEKLLEVETMVPTRV